MGLTRRRTSTPKPSHIQLFFSYCFYWVTKLAIWCVTHACLQYVHVTASAARNERKHHRCLDACSTRAEYCGCRSYNRGSTALLAMASRDNASHRMLVLFPPLLPTPKWVANHPQYSALVFLGGSSLSTSRLYLSSNMHLSRRRTGAHAPALGQEKRQICIHFISVFEGKALLVIYCTVMIQLINVPLL